MKVHHVKQGSGEWATLRLGIPTASELDALVTPEGKLRTGQGPRSYLVKKICERLLGFATGGGSWATEQGSILETEALPWFEFTQGVTVDRVGFVTTDDGRFGASPDGLIGKGDGLEVKSYQPEHALAVLLDGEVPKDHTIQIQACMHVCEAGKWWFLSYSRQWPPLLLRVERDEKIQKAIAEALKVFNASFDEALEKVKKLKEANDAPKAAAHFAEARTWGDKS
jgi:hypothetical protein